MWPSPVSGLGPTAANDRLPLLGMPTDGFERLFVKRTLSEQPFRVDRWHTNDRRVARSHTPLFLPLMHELDVHASRWGNRLFERAPDNAGRQQVVSTIY